MFSDDSTQQRPRILVLAGPNGSGKSTITKGLAVVGVYVNADDIKQHARCSDLEAAKEATSIREMLLADKKDFSFETVLSTNRNLELLEHAKAAGYRIFAVFVLTRDSSINVKRVKARAAAGGHDVPEEKIIERYTRSLQNLSRLVRIADTTRVVDNSEKEPQLICEVVNSSVRIWESPLWSKTDILKLLTLPDESEH